MRHFLTLFDLSTDEIQNLLTEAARLKKDLRKGKQSTALQGKVVALIFEKPSLRTRVSFETGVAQLGGTSLFLPGGEVGLGTRESLADFARTVCQYVDGLVLRTFRHTTIEGLAAHASKPVINGLSDLFHPCQALGDLLSLHELFPEPAGRTLVFVGDGNNVARSLAVGCGMLGIRFVLAAPAGYGFDDAFLERYRSHAPEGDLEQLADPVRAVRSADVIYTDVWTSMGQEAEREERLRRFNGFQVNAGLLAKAPAHARIMHCLPAHRGEEISHEVLEDERSIVFEQAQNRMHAQKALLVWLLSAPHERRPSSRKTRTASRRPPTR